MACQSFSARASHKITVEKPTRSTDSYGGATVSWSTVATVWADIQPASGRELFAQNATQSRVTHKITIRYKPEFKDITQISAYRISYDGRLFAINSIANVADDMKAEGKSYQVISAEENGPDVQG